MGDDVDALLAAGAASLGQGDWVAAREAFEQAVQVQPVAEAHFGLSDAMWWLGHLAGCLDHRERAYAAFRERPDPAQAALCALLLSFDYRKQMGNPAAAAGWLGRAARLVEDSDVEELRGWLLFGRAFQHEDPRQGEHWAREACEVARRQEDRDLELSALSELGSALVRQGRIAEGVACLDEAMAAALGGEGNPETVVVTSCNMMLSCTRCAEFERAVQWVRATDRFVQRYGCPFLYAECRIVFGSVLLATGQWQLAEEELRAAVDTAEASVPALHRQALACLAQLRLDQGRLEEAERLLVGGDDHTESAEVRARVALMRGHPDVAAAVVARRLDALGDDPLMGASLVELIGEAEIAQGRWEQAADRARSLVGLGADRGCDVVTARGERLWGRALTVAGDGAAARPHLEAALSVFSRLEMPVEAARARLLLAEAVAAAQPDLAEGEAQTALACFERIGAGGDADRAAAFLRARGVKAARTAARTDDLLTKREREVLELLGDGLSNPEIAARLYVSRKTVEHHVSAVLSKLGLRSRTEAAAEAVRRREGSAAK